MNPILSPSITYGLLFLGLVSIYVLYRFCKNNESAILTCLFVKLPQMLDSLFRAVDYWFSKSYGHKLLNMIFIKGQPKAIIIMIILAVFFLIGGLAPTWGKVPAAFAATLLITVLICYLTKWLEGIIPAESRHVVLKYLRSHALHFVSSVMILSLSAVIWFFLATPADSGFFYKHTHIPIITALIIMSYVSLFIRTLVFDISVGANNSEKFKQFSNSVNKTKLFWTKEDPVVSWATAFYGLFSGPTYHVLKLLLLPSIVVIFLPTELVRYYVWIPLLIFSWLLLALCTVHRRLHFVLSATKRWFLTGGQFIVSFVIIILAIGRIADISYVATLLDGIPVFHVLFFVLSAYSALWLYEYWSNSLLCNHLLGYLRSGDAPDKDQISRVPYEYKNPDKKDAEKLEGYFIQLYSGARFAIIEEQESGKNTLHAIHEKRAIFEEISKINSDLGPLFSDLSKRIMLYFTLQNLLMILLAGATIYWIVIQDAKPMINATRITSTSMAQSDYKNVQKVDLKKLVLNRKPGNDKHVIFLAASGGGTRAAIYTTSLLAALQEIGMLDNVVLASGVSGGGMSLAYLSAHREELIKTLPEDCSNTDGESVKNIWCKYINVVSGNHIMQVASRIGEAQLFVDTSLGQFLADSFERSFYEVNNDGGYDYLNLDQLSDMGLILNTSLIAHPYGESNMLSDAMGPYEKEQGKIQEKEKKRSKLYKIDAGGRLIFTNIQNLKSFPWDNSENLFKDSADVRFKYVIAGGENIPLHTIGALTANFPPVFPNAIVELDGKNYSVSDGGAVENRGLLSLMFALRSLIEQVAQSKADLKKLPTIHVVMAEASGVSVDYSNFESGLAAIGNARVMIGNQLVLELKSILKEKCGKPCADKLQFHYLNMPLMMRARGGLGTHWKMPSRVSFEVPALKDDTPDTKLEISGIQTICLMQELFAKSIKNRSAPVIKGRLQSDVKHIQCTQDMLPEVIRSAFLDKQEALQRSWKRLKMSLKK